jgi:hypothetical protein
MKRLDPIDWRPLDELVADHFALRRRYATPGISNAERRSLVSRVTLLTEEIRNRVGSGRASGLLGADRPQRISRPTATEAYVAGAWQSAMDEARRKRRAHQ